MNDSIAVFGLLAGLADDSASIPYRRVFNQVTGGVLSSILLQQFIYRFSKNGFKKFYKFKEPCGHSLYKDGDDWLAETGFSRSEFDTAISRIATKIKKGESKADAMSTSSAKTLIIYWTDSNRVTWYELNVNALRDILLPLFIEVEDEEEDFSDMFDKKHEQPTESCGITEMDVLGVTAMARANETGESELNRIGWYIRSSEIAEIIFQFSSITGIGFPNSKSIRSKWVSGASELLSEFGGDVIPLMRAAWSEYYKDVVDGNIDITHPRALLTKMVAVNERGSMNATSAKDVTVIRDDDGGMYL